MSERNSFGILLRETVQIHSDGGKEYWRDIPGYVGSYRASSWGRVRSLARWIACNNGGRRFSKESLLKIQIGKTGYYVIALRKDGDTKLCKVHRLVLEAFVCPCPEHMQCRHMNGNCLDNRLENLTWGTSKENIEDRDRHGTTACGSRSGMAKLTEEDAIEIHKLYQTGDYTYKQLAKKFSIACQCVSGIVKGESFKRLGLKPVGVFCKRGHHLNSRGPGHGNAKFTEEDARTIRARCEDYYRGLYSRLAEEYSTNTTTIREIALRMRYKDIV